MTPISALSSATGSSARLKAKECNRVYNADRLESKTKNPGLHFGSVKRERPCDIGSRVQLDLSFSRAVANTQTAEELVAKNIAAKSDRYDQG